jgi:methionine biosynthesis protein MetW
MRYDHSLISRFVKPESKVIDLGCGDGELLFLLKKEKKVTAKGIDIKEEKIEKCLEKGLSVVQLDIEKGLKDYKNNTFEYVILNDTLQTVNHPIDVLNESVRIGKKVIITFPNFAHFSIRFSLLITGRMPKSKTLPYEWYNTPNIHLFTIKDFRDLCERNNFKIIKSLFFNSKNGKGNIVNSRPNFSAKNALFIITKK